MLFLSEGHAETADQPAAQTPGQAETSAEDQPEVQDLGGQRFRVGPIEIDRAAGRFHLAATLLRDGPPLEFLAARIIELCSRSSSSGERNGLELVRPTALLRPSPPPSRNDMWEWAVRLGGVRTRHLHDE